jgi:hypothetical protein
MRLLTPQDRPHLERHNHARSLVTRLGVNDNPWTGGWRGGAERCGRSLKTLCPCLHPKAGAGHTHVRGCLGGVWTLEPVWLQRGAKAHGLVLIGVVWVTIDEPSHEGQRIIADNPGDIGKDDIGVGVIEDKPSKSTPCDLKAFAHRWLWDFPNSSLGRKTYLKWNKLSSYLVSIHPP